MVAHVKPSAAAAIVTGARTPMVKAGDALREMHVTDLAAAAFAETLYRAALPGDKIVPGSDPGHGVNRP